MQPIAENLQDLFDNCGTDLANAIEKRLRPLYVHGQNAAPDLTILQRNRTENQRPELKIALAAAQEERPQLVPRILRQIEDGFHFYPAQVKAIGETVAMLREHGAGFLVADCGSGKGPMSAAAIHIVMEKRRKKLRFRRRRPAPYRVLVMCPNHLVDKWKREAGWLVPNCEAIIIRTFADIAMLHRPFRQRRIRELQATKGVAAKRKLNKALALADALKHKNLYVIISKDTAKLGHDVACPCAVPRFNSTNPPHPKHGKWAGCPRCGNLLMDKKGKLVAFDKYHENRKAKRLRCEACGQWATKHARNRIDRPHIDQFIHRQLKGFFDAYIADEVHELKGGATEQGNALGTLAASARYTLALTGTFSGGYAKDVHAMLWRVAPLLMGRHGFDLAPFANGQTTPIERNEMRFQKRYGVMKSITTTSRGDLDDSDISSRRVTGRGHSTRTREFPRPGQSPELFMHYMLGRSIFLGIDEISKDLPELERELIPCPMSDELRKAYADLAGQLDDARQNMMRKRRGNSSGPPPLVAQIPRILMDYADHPWGWKPICVPEYDKEGEFCGMREVAVPRDLGAGRYDMKDDRVIEYCQNEFDQGRKVAVYCTSTGVRDVRAKITKALLKRGLRVGVLSIDHNNASYHTFNDLATEYGDALLLRRNDTPKTREAWLNAHKGQMDVLVVNPERVMTGLDLIAFPTLVWYQVGFKTFVLRQASARSWRPGQTQHCKVIYFYYQNTKQEVALALMGEKEAASQALEGKFDTQALRTMMNGDEADVLTLLSESLDRQFDARSVWLQAKSKPKPEPNPVQDKAKTENFTRPATF